jgi:hypothetical protein
MRSPGGTRTVARALEKVWERFEHAAGVTSLSEELIADRRREAAAEDASARE